LEKVKHIAKEYCRNVEVLAQKFVLKKLGEIKKYWGSIEEYWENKKITHHVSKLT
jgi:hypothetical protein